LHFLAAETTRGGSPMSEQDGVLSITLDKVAEKKARTVDVKGA
jgi:hypothetical protein